MTSSTLLPRRDSVQPSCDAGIRRRRWFFCLGVAFLTTAGATAAEPEIDAPQPSPLQEVRNGDPAFLVRASVDRPSRVYCEGDTLTTTAVSEQAGHLYAMYQQADGTIYQIFPNSAQPENRIEADQSVTLPAGADRFTWIVAAPFGREVLKIIVSKQPLKALDDPALRQKLFNPIAAKQLAEAQDELLASDGAEWAEFDVELTTQAAERRPDGGRVQRAGVFFGVSRFEFNAEVEAATEGEQRLDLPTGDRDAIVLAELMRDVGRLNACQVFANEQATRANFEEAVTRWLPGHTQPGDVAFIYFSGHGGPLTDDNGDEADGMDEMLVPHDYANPLVLDQLISAARAGTLDSRRAQRLQQLLAAAGLANGVPSGTSIEEIGQRIARATAVTDDQFGHWLQALDGRRVVVVLDICHAGGFATLEKSLAEPAAIAPFDFLDQELTRLKDIGQENALLLASSSKDVSSLCRNDDFPQQRGPFSVFTSYLVEQLLAPADTITMQQAYESCQSGMEDYFRERDPAVSHFPVLIGGPESAAVQLAP